MQAQTHKDQGGESKTQEASLIRQKYNEAIREAYNMYCECEEIAAYAALEIFRLQNQPRYSAMEEQEKTERLNEKSQILVSTKSNLIFILDRMHELARDRDKYISDIYMSKKIIDIEERLNNLTPWLQDISQEMKGKAEAAKLYAKIASEVLSMGRNQSDI